jgi:mono/diheme cytochrome c family protein
VARNHGGRVSRPGIVAAVALGLLLVLAAGERTAAHDPITTKVTFSREVRAILGTRCVICHSAGGAAPMPLTTYDETRPWARAIKEQVLTRRMPKWHAARGFGSFTNDFTLTPFEIALLVSWIDGGLPRGAGDGGVAPAARVGSAPATQDDVVMPLAVPADRNALTRRMPSGWVVAWDFRPGDPLITSASLTLGDGTAIGTWVAGDRPVVLPAGSALRLTGTLHVELHRRAAADYERPRPARPSMLRLVTRTTPPAQRIWTQRGVCSSIQTDRNARAIAIRPVLADGASAEIAVERIGAPGVVIGWFRNFEAAYPRTYWLAQPVEFGPDARLRSDGPCEAELTLQSVTGRR